METIEQVFGKFLAEQEERLSPRTYNRYLDVMQLFRICLNNYAYQYLSSENTMIFWRNTAKARNFASCSKSLIFRAA